MKKSLISFITVMMLAISASGASAASKNNEVQVILNGNTLVFAQKPVIMQNKTYVEFRTLFEKLGYEIEFEQKNRTIVATTQGHKIEMSLNGDVAFVDGKTVNSKGEMKVVKNRTMVGVRFIADLSGKDVKWDAAQRIVTLLDNGPTKEQEAAVLSLFDKIAALEAAADADGLTALFAADTPLDTKSIVPDWKNTKTKTTVKEAIIQTYSEQETFVKVKDETVRLNGGYFVDNRMEMRYTLHKDAASEWKIYNMEPVDVQIIKDKLPGLFDLAVTVPDADKTAILAVLDAQMKANNSENLADYLATLVFKSEEQKAQTSQMVKAVFDQIDVNTTVEKSAIVEFENSKATLLLSALSEVKTGGRTVKVRTILQNGAEKVDGKWLLSPQAIPLDSQPLE